MKLLNKKGFTMVELVIIITILSILMLITIQHTGNILQRTRAIADCKNAELIGQALERAIASEMILYNHSSDIVIEVGNPDPPLPPYPNDSDKLTSCLEGGGKITETDPVTFISGTGEVYLGHIPQPKSVPGYFAVSISPKGSVNVLAGGIAGDILFPKPATFSGPYAILNK